MDIKSLFFFFYFLHYVIFRQSGQQQELNLGFWDPNFLLPLFPFGQVRFGKLALLEVHKISSCHEIFVLININVI